MINKAVLDELEKELDPAFKRRAKIIIEQLALKQGSTVLEVGCGRGYYANVIGNFFPHVSYIGIDINGKYLQVAKTFAQTKNVSFQKVDGTKLTFPDNTFDKIICTEVLEHIENDHQVISEIYRVLKPKGVLLITVPNKNYPFYWDPLNFILERIIHTHIPSNIWWLAGIWADHVRLYSEDEILKKTKHAGFKLENLIRSTHFCFPFAHFILYGLGKNIIERGWLASLNRFSPENKKSLLSSFIFGIIGFFDRKNDKILFTKKNSFVNLVLICTK